MPELPVPGTATVAGARLWLPGRMLAAIFAIGVLLCCVGAGAASASTVPREGTFENCPLDTAMPLCAHRLKVMRAGGMRVVVISAWSGSIPALASYAATAHRLGMSVMWELSNPDWWQQPASATGMAGYLPGFTAACGCKQNGPLLAYVTRWLGALPGTYGYYAADDSMLPRHDRAAVASYVREIKHNDHRHTVLISSFSQSQANQYEGLADETAQEIYPVKTRSLLPVRANQSAWSSVARSAARTQQAATRAHKPSAFILQAFTWGDNIDDGVSTRACTAAESKWSCHASLRYPSRSAQLELRNDVLLHAHPKLILWWSFPGTYGQAGDDTYSIYPTGKQAAVRWAGLSAAVRAPMPWTASSRR